MKLEILTPDELTPEDEDVLRAADISLDDFDYIVIAPPDTLIGVPDTRRERDEDDMPHDVSCERLIPSDDYYILEQLMWNVSQAQWFRVEFRGKLVALGMAYH